MNRKATRMHSTFLTHIGALAAVVAAFAQGCSGDDGPDAAAGGSGAAAGNGGVGGATGGAGAVPITPDAGDAGAGAGGDAGQRQPLDALEVPKFEVALVIPPAMPPLSVGTVTEYAIAVRQFEQQVLPPSYPPTTVWGYGRDGDPLPGTAAASTFHYPSFTIEARSGEPFRVSWVNRLVDEDGKYLPHLLPVDQTLDWSNPGGAIEERGTDASPYTGPIPIVTHVHGGHTAEGSDGHPLGWYLPAATNIPSGYTREGSRYASLGSPEPGSALFEYPNDQRASTVWFHDHAFGLTRLNVYAGLAGFYLIRDAEEDALGLPGPAPQVGDAPGTRYYEIPLAIQDKAFFDDGSLRYPSSRSEFDGYEGPYAPDTDVSPIWNPEVFGDMIVVNGRTWPYLEVEPRLYRLRIVNGCNARFLRLGLDEAGVRFHQIGGDGGLLSGAPAVQTDLLLGPGERADVIVDFSSLSPGEDVLLLNSGPDEPFKGPRVSQDPANAETTGQVMQFRIVEATGQGVAGQIPAALPTITPLATTLPSRDVTLNEMVNEAADIPVAAVLGTAAEGPLGFDAPVTETPTQGTTEIWRIVNLTEDAHPIHLHQVTFQVLDRIPFDVEGYAGEQEEVLESGGTMPVVDDFFTAAPVVAGEAESCWKDTVTANPGEVTRVIATFDLPGQYVWHCHILEHEDNEMMRPFDVRPAP